MSSKFITLIVPRSDSDGLLHGLYQALLMKLVSVRVDEITPGGDFEFQLELRPSDPPMLVFDDADDYLAMRRLTPSRN